MTERRRGLGRGLGALIPQPAESQQSDQSPDTAPDEANARQDHRPQPGEHGLGVDQHLGPGQPAAPLTQVGTPTTAREPGNASDPARLAAPAQVAAPVDQEVHTPGLVTIPGASFAEIPIHTIRPNPRQPRTVFDEDELAELTASITEVGLLQPIVVRPRPDGYELIMGERRWRAAGAAGLQVVPAIVRDTDDENLLRDALLENLHRSQLNPLEEAAAYQQLLDDFGCTQEELASRIGRSRPQVSNTLRLLRLPPLVQRRVAAGVLSAGHARALLGLADGGAMERLAQRIVAEGLSVRSVEEIVAVGEDPQSTRGVRTPRIRPATPGLVELESKLSDFLDTRAKIAMGARKGRVTIEFATVEDLARILAAMGVDPADQLPED